ncbi:chemotaxis protein CheW [Pseudohongiella acticola]|jgi:purine-binding chemotaxis protein CheW|uniref:chemotaxis protein CheW n=1 Tax=Pseudohongiella acticola TaxID=1524254 RepID=UPI0030EBCAEC
MVNEQVSTQTHSKSASQGVVQDYLDVLLRNVLPDEEPQPDLTSPSQAVSTQMAATVSEATSLEEWPADPVASPVLQQVVAPEPELAPEQTLDLSRVETPTTNQEQEQEQAGASMPWAEKPFASLLFDVVGLKLAAPLHELGGIMPLADKLQPMVAQADWFMGLIRWNGKTIRVVDTARFVMPERVDAEQQIEYQSIVVLGDSHWALAVNNADQSAHLQPADIRWRRTSGKRPWLAGTVLGRLCALLDVEVLVSMLDASDTARQIKADLLKED